MEIGKPLPSWYLAPIFGESIPKPDDFKGKPLLILFFYLGCPGCVGRAIPFANRVVVFLSPFSSNFGKDTFESLLINCRSG